MSYGSLETEPAGVVDDALPDPRDRLAGGGRAVGQRDEGGRTSGRLAHAVQAAHTTRLQLFAADDRGRGDLQLLGEVYSFLKLNSNC